MTTSAVIAEDTFREVRDLVVHRLLPPLPRGLIRWRAVLGPLAGLAFVLRPVHRGVVLCSSSGWSHWTRGRAPRLVYCHTPARWLYEPGDYFHGLSPRLRGLASLALRPLRIVDRRRMASAAMVVANGPVTAARIRRAYGIDSKVIVPPPGIDPRGPQQPVAGIRHPFCLSVARPRSYKHLDVARRVFDRRAAEQLVIVGGPACPSAEGHVVEAGHVTDAELRWLYAHARAVVCLANEDLGLVPLEAFQFGTPVVALEAGGYLATCTAGVNTIFVEAADEDSLSRALDALDERPFTAEAIRASATAFSVTRFHEQISACLTEVLADDDRPAGRPRDGLGATARGDGG